MNAERRHCEREYPVSRSIASPFSRERRTNALTNARVFLVSLSRNRRRADGISSGKLDRAFAHLRSIAAYRPSRRLLENVHDRYSARRHSRVTRLFLAQYPAVCSHVSKRRTRRSHDFHASVKSYLDCVCCNRSASVGACETNRQKPGKSLGDGPRASYRWNRDVDR